MDEAQVEIERLVGTLGDKYTRYLPPAKYRSIVDSATGTLAGVGVEISFSLDKESGRIIVADTEPTSPASIGTYIRLFVCLVVCLFVYKYAHGYGLDITSWISQYFFLCFTSYSFVII